MIRTGAMLLQDGTSLPEPLGLATVNYLENWSTITGFTGTLLRNAIEHEGWTLFFMAGEIHASAYGLSDQSQTARAMLKLIESVKLERCNCMEITQMTQRSFLGLRSTTISAHARHIQQSNRFEDLSKTPKI